MKSKLIRVLEDVCPELLEYEGKTAIEDGILDAYLLDELCEALEEEFDVSISEDLKDEENFGSIRSILELIEELLG